MCRLHCSGHAPATLADDGIRTLRLTGAGALNIVGSTQIAELRAALLGLSAEPALGVLVLRGSGERAFIGRAGIGETATLNPATAGAFNTGLAALCDAVAEVPVIASLFGWWLGGGLEVALACDVRLCDEDAMFGMPEIKVGIPPVIHAALLPRRLGHACADWLLLTCENIAAARVEAWGLRPGARALRRRRAGRTGAAAGRRAGRAAAGATPAEAAAAPLADRAADAGGARQHR